MWRGVLYDLYMYISFTANTSIDSFVGTISGLGTDDGCSRSGAPSGNFDLCPAPGEDVTLTCTSSDTNSTLIMTPGGTSVSSPLIINSIDASAEGEYTCIASNLQCSDVNPTLTIILCELHYNDTHTYIYTQLIVKIIM